MLSVRVPGKVVFMGEHFVQRGSVAYASSVDVYVYFTARCSASPSSSSAFDVRPATYAPLLEMVVDAVGRTRCETAAPSYVIDVDDSSLPQSVGLGSSSAILVGLTAIVLALVDGTSPPSKRDVYLVASRIERDATGASGLDVAACVYGGVRFSRADVAPHPLFAPACSILLTGTAHTASCAHPVDDDTLREYDALPPSPSSMPRVDALLVRIGLGFEEAERVYRVVPRAKMTGRCGGGAMIVVPPLTREEARRVSAVARVFRRVARVTCGGYDVQVDTRFSSVPRELMAPASASGASLLLPLGREATASAPSNIALVKYWGKRAAQLQMPSNASVSLTLPYCVTSTRLCVVEEASGGRESDDARVRDFVRRVLECEGVCLPDGCVVGFESTSNFPRACGIASSASGFAALTLALERLLDVDPCRRDAWVQHWARIGSGSAVRSVVARAGEERPALVSWTSSRATVHAPSPLCDLEHALVVFNPFPKKTGSSDGHSLAPTSPFFGVRTAMADDNVAAVVAAFSRGDFDTVRRVTETEAMTMHMTMWTSDPSVRYLSPACLGFVQSFIRYRDEHRLKAIFTIDAGENVHLLYDERAAASILSFARMASHGHAFLLRRGVKEHARTAVVVCGKRYAGKTTLCDAWKAKCERAEESLKDDCDDDVDVEEDGYDTLVCASGGVRFTTISEAIKRDYWSKHVAPHSLGSSFASFYASREAKELHRRRMVDFAEEQIRSEGPHVWVRRAWEDAIRGNTCGVVVVTDARRKADVAFFRACARCVCVRVECDDATREERGWARDDSVDASESETGLDDASFDVLVDGSGRAQLPSLADVVSKA